MDQESNMNITSQHSGLNRAVNPGKLARARREEAANRQLADIIKKSRFTQEQVLALMRMFSKLSVAGRIDRIRFRDFVYSAFGINDNLVLDRMFSIFSEDAAGVSETKWISCVSLMTRGSLEDKIAYVFKVYDITGDKSISREEVGHFLRTCLNTNHGETVLIDPDEMNDAIKDIGDQVFRKLDADKNGLISEEDFQEACYANPLLLESLGHCIPSNNHIKSFLVLFCDDYTSFESNLSNPIDPTFSGFRESRGSSNRTDAKSRRLKNSSGNSNIVSASAASIVDSNKLRRKSYRRRK